MALEPWAKLNLSLRDVVWARYFIQATESSLMQIKIVCFPVTKENAWNSDLKGKVCFGSQFSPLLAGFKEEML